MLSHKQEQPLHTDAGLWGRQKGNSDQENKLGGIPQTSEALQDHLLVVWFLLNQVFSFLPRCGFLMPTIVLPMSKCLLLSINSYFSWKKCFLLFSGLCDSFSSTVCKNMVSPIATCSAPQGFDFMPFLHFHSHSPSIS